MSFLVIVFLGLAVSWLGVIGQFSSNAATASDSRLLLSFGFGITVGACLLSFAWFIANPVFEMLSGIGY